MSNQVYGYITDKIMEELERGCVRGISHGNRPTVCGCL